MSFLWMPQGLRYVDRQLEFLCVNNEIDGNHVMRVYVW